MPSITPANLDDVIYLMQDGYKQNLKLCKRQPTLSAQIYMSTWAMPGLPGAAATPPTGSGAVCSKATNGALKFNNPQSGLSLKCAYLRYNCATNGLCHLYDRLVHTSGLSGTVTTAQTVNSTTLPTRVNSDGYGVEIWLEWYTATGATARNVFVTYTNQNGNTATSPSVQLKASMAAQNCINIPLAAGDTGVRSVIDVTLSGTTGTAGNFGVTLAKPINIIASQSSSYSGKAVGIVEAGLQPIHQDACLFCIISSANSSAITNGILTADIGLVETL